MRRRHILRDARSGSQDEGEPVGALPERTATTPMLPAWPDLVLIDGGQGQLDAARAGASPSLASPACRSSPSPRGRTATPAARVSSSPGRSPFKLPPRDPALYFVQRLRDEAHRFAIGTHRARRKKEFTKSPLDEIEGIGPARKRALLHTFGTAKAIARASLADLEKVAGINAATARHDL